MYICYVDEAGCTGVLPGPSSAIQPVFAIVGLIVRQDHIRAMTHELIQLKQKFFPNLVPAGSRYHDWMAAELKGSDIRRLARSTNRNERRHAYGVVKAGLDILTKHNVRMTGRVFVKPFGGAFNGTAVYSSSVQRICVDFQHYLSANDAWGQVIADSRNKQKNANISHSVFTQQFSAAGNPYPNLIEAPTFGHSDNHAGLQLSDLVCSALMYPIAAQVCCLPHMTNTTHCWAQHSTLKARYGAVLRTLEYRYSPSAGVWWGGIHLSDPLSGRVALDLFV